MASFEFNRTFLGGRLTADPELKTTPTGVMVVSFTVAVNRRKAENGKQATDYINCVAWRKTAEFISKYFRKGSSIFVGGELQTRTWKATDGSKRYATEVNVNEVRFVDSKSNSTANGEDTTPHFEEVGGEDDLPF